jgi:hypothetical protein
MGATVTMPIDENGMMRFDVIVADLFLAQETHLVDRKLFALVNRTLNAHGYRAHVLSSDDMHLEFKIVEIPK